MTFRAQPYELRAGIVRLEPMTAVVAQRLAGEIAAIDPWRTLGVDAAVLARGFLARDDHLLRFAIIRDGGPAGVVSVRDPWLFGPYLALLAILPEHQGAGIGATVLHWLEGEARATSGNVWACVSQFNAAARRFYARHGFEEVGGLADLVRPGHDEILIRKRLQP